MPGLFCYNRREATHPAQREAKPARLVAHEAGKHYIPLAVRQQGRNACGAEMPVAESRAASVPRPVLEERQAQPEFKRGWNSRDL